MVVAEPVALPVTSKVPSPSKSNDHESRSFAPAGSEPVAVIVTTWFSAAGLGLDAADVMLGATFVHTSVTGADVAGAPSPSDTVTVTATVASSLRR